MNLKKILSLGLSLALIAATGPAQAAPIPSQTARIPSKETQVQVQEKKALTVEEAIKKAISHNLNLKKYELTRESLLKQIDSTYNNDQSIFQLKEYQESQLPDPEKDKDAYDKGKQEIDSQFQQALGISDYSKASLINQRSSIDVSTVMERESVGLSIQRLFTSIQQKEKDIEILEKKIAQEGKNLNLYVRQLELGKISQSKYEELALETTKNTNKLSIEKGKLSNYYRELENITLLSNLERDYDLEEITYDYQPLVLDLASQKVKEQSAADLSSLVSSKRAAMKIAESKYENYPYVSGESSYTQIQDERYLSQLEESQAIREAKASAQTKYNSLQELQENIGLAQKDIKKLENQLKDLRGKYSLGLISKNTLDNSLFALEEAQNSLLSLKTQHYQLKQTYENPYFRGL